MLLLILVFSCDTVREDKLNLLNGYWEIEEVVFPNGDTKAYNISQNVDYIQIDGLKGFRKKVNPKFNGNFETSDDAVLFEIQQQDDTFTMVYKNEQLVWKETITAIATDHFSIQNEDGVLYNYNRFEPISITP